MRPDAIRALRVVPDSVRGADRRDRIIFGTALLVIVVASWLYLVYLAQSMTMHGSGAIRLPKRQSGHGTARAHGWMPLSTT